MADTPLRSRRPYLLRAMHEWISDCNQTPHIVVDASMQGVEVPRQYVQNGKIILNVSHNATSGLVLGNDSVRFRARFGDRVAIEHPERWLGWRRGGPRAAGRGRHGG